MGWADKYAKATTSRGEELPPLAPQQAYDRGVGIRTNAMTDVQGSNPDPAGMIDAARFATIEDPQVRIQKFAESRFPDEPPEVREGRYRVVDGDVVYRGPDGKIYPEISGPGATIADFAGKSFLPMAGAILGTMMGGPVGGAALGMGGLGWTKTAGLAQGDRQDSDKNAKDILLQGAVDYAVPAAGGKIVEKFANRRAARDVISFDRAATQRLMDSARRHGVTLTPAEASNLGSLINQQTRYGRGMDEAGDVMKKFYGDRAEQVAAAVEDFIGTTPGKMATGEAATKTASGIIRGAEKARSKAVAPTYKALMQSDGAMVPRVEFMQDLSEDTYLGEVIKKVKSDPKWMTSDGVNISKLPENHLAVIDRAKKYLDSEMKGLQKGDPLMAMLQDRKRTLLSHADAAFPEYKAIRAQYAGMSPEVDALKEGLIGQVAKLKGTKVDKASRVFLDESADPARIGMARSEFLRAGKAKEWDDLTNTWLQDHWSKANSGRTVKEAAGARFAEQVFGTPGKRAMLKEAVGPKRYKALEDLVEVLEATGRVAKGQSMTQPAQEAAKAEAREVAPVVSFAREVDVTRPLEALGNWWVENRTGNWRASLAKAITSPEAVKELDKLKVLRKLSPGSKRKTEVVLQALTKAGVIGSSYESAPLASPQGAPQPPPAALSTQ